MKAALVCGAGGFIGGHLVKRLKQHGFWVKGVDLKIHEYSKTLADEFVVGDLCDFRVCNDVIDRQFDEVYQLAAEMGGAEYIYNRDNDADIMRRSTTININVLESCIRRSAARILFASSACVYPERNQVDPNRPNCAEDSVYPAAPDSEYGWSKLFSERLFLAHGRCNDIQTRIARFHNIFGPEGTWTGGREKAPAALCRKVAQAENGGTLEIIGDGQQSRSFLYISEAIEGTIRLMRSSTAEPLNIGSDQMVTINQLADMIIDISGKSLRKNHVAGPTGVRGRNSDNRRIREALGWSPNDCLKSGLQQTYAWIETQIFARSQQQ